MRQMKYSVAALLALSVSSGAWAQDAAPVPIEPASPQMVEAVGSTDFDAKEAAPVPSIMFSETDIKNLSKVVVALRMREDPKQASATGAGTSEEDILNELLLQAGKREAELTTLPEFYLASLVYRSKGDWTIWLRVNRVAPAKKANKANQNKGSSRVEEIFKNVENVLGDNNSEAKEESPQDGGFNKGISISSDQPINEELQLRVEAISQDSVTLAYEPKELAAALGRYQNRENASARTWQFRNRLVTGEEITYDATSKEFVATIRMNQTFSPDLMRIVEGKTFSQPRPVSAAASQSGVDNASGASSASSSANMPAVDSDRALADKLINQVKTMQQFIPVPVKQQEGQ
jgi:hypothetical protein